MKDRLLGDVVAFTTLPSVWIGLPTEAIARSLALSLDRTLPLTSVAILLRTEEGDVEARAGDQALLDDDVAAWRAGRPMGAATLQLEVGPMGARGVILLRGDEMPAEQLLVARLAANLADNALREAALRHQAAIAREQALRLEKVFALGQLVSGVAHELRTPLTYANNSVYLARSRLARLTGLAPEARAEIDALLTEVLGAHERITRTVGTLRHLSNPRPGQRERFPLAEAVGEATRLFSLTHVGRVEIVRDLAGGALVDADRVEVQQVVLNLLQNAAEAMPRGGHVFVRTRDEEERAVLVVEDEGPGIPEAARVRLFDPFFTTKEAGTGLGLSIVRRIAETHDAVIEVGDAPGRGACFRVAFPRAPRAAEPASRALPLLPPRAERAPKA